MIIRNAKTVAWTLPALEVAIPAALRDGVVTFVYRAGLKAILDTDALIDGARHQVSVAPIDGYDADGRPFLQATVLP